jgi:hypothetical protein
MDDKSFFQNSPIFLKKFSMDCKYGVFVVNKKIQTLNMF